MNCKTLMKIFDCYRDRVIIIKYIMFISNINDSTKMQYLQLLVQYTPWPATAATYLPSWSRGTDSNRKKFSDTFLKNEISSKATSIFSDYLCIFPFLFISLEDCWFPFIIFSFKNLGLSQIRQYINLTKDDEKSIRIWLVHPTMFIFHVQYPSNLSCSLSLSIFQNVIDKVGFRETRWIMMTEILYVTSEFCSWRKSFVAIVQR